MQTDTRWAAHRYQAPGERSTIKKSGCGTTCAAMVIASLADDSVTPVTTAEWSMKHGYKAYGQGTYYSYFVPQMREYGIECEQLNSASIYHGRNGAQKVNQKALSAIKEGKWVICCMGVGDWAKSGHFILWYGLDDNGNALIKDPNSRKSSRRCAPVPKLQYQCKFYWVVEVEEEMTQEDFNKMLEAAPRELKIKIMLDTAQQMGLIQPEAWSQDARDWGYDQGIMTGGAYKRPATREEVIQVVYMYDKKKGEKQNAL